MLRLQAECASLSVDLAALALDLPVQKIAGVELDPGLRHEYFHGAAGVRFVNHRAPCERAAGGVTHEIVVVALTELQLLVVVVNARADGRRSAEVERAAVQALQLTGGNQGLIHRSELTGHYHHVMAQHVAFPSARKIPISVVSEVQIGRASWRERV